MSTRPTTRVTRRSAQEVQAAYRVVPTRKKTPRALLDVNVLIALLDADHLHHRRASDWLADNLSAGWACLLYTSPSPRD